MKKTLIIIAHPNWENSTHVKRLVDNVVDLAPQIDTKVLDTKGNFTIKEDQDLWLQYDNIVFAFPFWWYGMPWLLKKYIDEMMTPGFGYSFKGDLDEFKLRGKKFSYLVTVGNTADTYKKGAVNNNTVEAFLESLNSGFTLASTAAAVTGKVHPYSDAMLKPGIMFGASRSASDSEAESLKVAKEFVSQL